MVFFLAEKRAHVTLVLAVAPAKRRVAQARHRAIGLIVEDLVREARAALAAEHEAMEAGPQDLAAKRREHEGMSTAIDLKMAPPAVPRVGFFQDVLEGTAAAPWLWWAVALVAILALLLLGMKLLGLFPD